jgi:hypothetical protein
VLERKLKEDAKEGIFMTFFMTLKNKGLSRINVIKNNRKLKNAKKPIRIAILQRSKEFVL